MLNQKIHYSVGHLGSYMLIRLGQIETAEAGCSDCARLRGDQKLLSLHRKYMELAESKASYIASCCKLINGSLVGLTDQSLLLLQLQVLVEGGEYYGFFLAKKLWSYC